MTSIPHLMPAVLAEAKGEPLRLLRVSTPHPGPGDVLVRVVASGVNPLDAKILAGTAEHARQALPAILGIDMAGIVVAAGADTTEFQEGDAVYGMDGGAALDASFAMVRRFGHVVSALGCGTHALAPLSFRAASYSGVFTLLPLLTGEGRAHHGEILAEATRLAAAGKLVPSLDPRRFTLDTVSDAYRAIEAGTARGKLVVDVAEGVGS